MFDTSSLELQSDISGYIILNVTNSSNFDISGASVSSQKGDYSYDVTMSSKKRIGLNFGPTDSYADPHIFIHRGCNDCNTKVVVGYGDQTKTNESEELPPSGERGWDERTTASCYDNGSGSSSASASWGPPSETFSRAGQYTIDSRYDNLMVIPSADPTCSKKTYYPDDKRIHEIEVTDTDKYTQTKYTWSKYTHRLSYTTHTHSGGNVTHINDSTCTRDTYSHISGDKHKHRTCSYTTSTSSQSRTFSHTSTCGNISLSCNLNTQGKWSASVSCGSHGGYSPGTDGSPTGWPPSYVTYSSVSSSQTTIVSGDCEYSTISPYLNLDESMTLQSGLNLYRPSYNNANHDLIILFDSLENGGAGTERIQVILHDGPVEDPTGPYKFELQTSSSGILYDSHTHYGYISSGKTYTESELADIGYTINTTMIGYSDGVEQSGSNSYRHQTNLCHGNCHFGESGISFHKPKLQVLGSGVTSATINGPLIYDHVNDEIISHTFGSSNTIFPVQSYFTIPIESYLNVTHMRGYTATFDPATDIIFNPDVTFRCHLNASETYALNNLNKLYKTGEVIHIPILPEMKYVAYMGDDDCYWYDISDLPTPVSTIHLSDKTLRLDNGTIYGGDLTVWDEGIYNVGIIVDIDSAWQGTMYGWGIKDVSSNRNTMTGKWFTGNYSANLTATARVNGASGTCDPNSNSNPTDVYCTEYILKQIPPINNAQGPYFSYNLESWNNIPYVHDRQLTTYNDYVIGYNDGRCYGIYSLRTETHNHPDIMSIPNVDVKAGDTITFELNIVTSVPTIDTSQNLRMIDHTVPLRYSPTYVCQILEHNEDINTEINRAIIELFK